MPAEKQKLLDLQNVGRAVLHDLNMLGIHSVEELIDQDATQLFHQLEIVTGQRQDPCMWDIFCAIIHEAKTGKPTAWWTWTAQRKMLQKTGKLNHVV